MLTVRMNMPAEDGNSPNEATYCAFQPVSLCILQWSSSTVTLFLNIFNLADALVPFPRGPEAQLGVL
ncbi:MAG: hypothetical protein FGF51_02465 [Candidatus Brockarchaeota archaeon]|nr:hypothetical protein [Candidatus Brockarchaeota archaeon]